MFPLLVGWIPSIHQHLESLTNSILKTAIVGCISRRTCNFLQVGHFWGDTKTFLKKSPLPRILEETGSYWVCVLVHDLRTISSVQDLLCNAKNFWIMPLTLSNECFYQTSTAASQVKIPMLAGHQNSPFETSASAEQQKPNSSLQNQHWLNSLSFTVSQQHI